MNWACSHRRCGCRSDAAERGTSPASRRTVPQSPGYWSAPGWSTCSRPTAGSARPARHRAAVAAGRLKIETPLLGLVTTAGCLLAYLHVRREAPELLGQETADELAERILRMMGMSLTEAHEVSHRLLPPTLDAAPGQ